MTRFSLNFALRELRHNKKLFRGTFLLMLFTSFLLAVVFTLGDSIAKTAVEQRFDAYGSYRYYSDSAQLSITQGQISLLGEEAAGGAVGFTDEAARSMGRVRCLEGRLPENENEAAVELGALSSMGYSYDLGQEIKLAVYLYTADGLSPEAVTKTVTLCGTLQDRSALWAAELPSIFLTRGGGKELLQACREAGGSPALNRVVLYESGELSREECEAARLDKNIQAYPDFDPKNLDALMLFIIGLIFTVCGGLFAAVMSLSVQKRKETWRTIRKIGGSRRKIFSVVLLEEFCLAAVSVPFGMTAGILSAWGMTLLLSRSNFIFSLEGAHLLAALVITLFCIAAGSTAAASGAAKTEPLPKLKRKKAGKEKTSFRPGRASALGMMGARLRLHPVSSLCCLLLPAGAAVFSAFIFMGISTQLSVHRMVEGRVHNADYIFEAVSAPEQNGILFDRQDLDRVGGAYGVGRVYAYSIYPASGSFTLDLSEKRDPYYEWMDMEYRARAALQSGVKPWRELTQDPKAVRVRVTGLRGREEAERFLEASENGGLADLSSLLAGDSCILYLPPICKTAMYSEESLLGGSLRGQDDRFAKAGIDFQIIPFGVAEDAARASWQGQALRNNTSIQIGDTLTVAFDGQRRSVKVAAILRGLTDTSRPFPNEPYEVITGSAFFDGFTGCSIAKLYNLMTVKAAENADPYSVDKQMSRIHAELGRKVRFENNRIQYNESLEKLLTNAAVSLLLLALYFAVALVLLSLIYSARLEENRRRIAAYKMLGATDRKIKGSFALEGLLFGLIALCSSVIVLYTFWIPQDVYLYGFIYPLHYYLVPEGAHAFLWPLFAGFILLLWAASEYLCLAPLKKFLAEAPAQQMRGS